ncbi:hypothetical protein CSUI_006869, partial [Cystoisospora suis]
VAVSSLCCDTPPAQAPQPSCHPLSGCKRSQESSSHSHPNQQDGRLPSDTVQHRLSSYTENLFLENNPAQYVSPCFPQGDRSPHTIHSPARKKFQKGPHNEPSCRYDRPPSTWQKGHTAGMPTVGLGDSRGDGSCRG